MIRILFILLLAAMPLTAVAEPVLQPGSALKPVTLETQWGFPVTVDTTVQVLLYSTDRKSGEQAHLALKNRKGPELENRKLIYSIDYGGIPTFAAKWFIAPKMQEYTYPIALDKDSSLRKQIPVQKGKVTILFLDDLLVQDLMYAESASEIATLFGE